MANINQLMQLMREGEFDNPNWNKYNKIHNWKNYIPYELQQAWGSLSDETKACLKFVAQQQADNEEWD